MEKFRAWCKVPINGPQRTQGTSLGQTVFTVLLMLWMFAMGALYYKVHHTNGPDLDYIRKEAVCKYLTGQMYHDICVVNGQVTDTNQAIQ